MAANAEFDYFAEAVDPLPVQKPANAAAPKLDQIVNAENISKIKDAINPEKLMNQIKDARGKFTIQNIAFNAHSWVELFRPKNFSYPSLCRPVDIGKRYCSNITNLYLNYVAIVLVLMFVWVLSKPLVLLLIIFATFLSAYVQHTLENMQLSIAGHEISNYLNVVLLVFNFLIFYLFGILGAIMTPISVGLLLSNLHALFYDNPNISGGV